MMEDPHFNNEDTKIESMYLTGQNLDCGRTIYYRDYELVKVGYTFPGHDEYEVRHEDEAVATVDIGDFRSAERLQDRIDEIIAKDQQDGVEVTD